MPFNGIGGFTLVAGNPVITGTTISSTVQNNTMTDFANGFANTMTRDGQSPALANIPMGNFKLTGLAAATTNGDAVRWEQVPLLTNLSDITDPLKGAGMVGLGLLNTYPVNTVGWAINADQRVNVLRYVPISEWTALQGGTSTLDLTTYIQQAFTAAIAKKGVVVFPFKGPWKCGEISVNGPCGIEGNGAEITLTSSAATAVYWVKWTASFSGFFAKDIKVTGTGVAADHQYGFGPTTSSIVVTDPRFTDVSCGSVTVGIDLSATVRAKVRGGLIGPTVGTASGQGYGIAIGTASVDAEINGVTFDSCTRHACYFGNVTGGQMIGCFIKNHRIAIQSGSQFSAVAVSRSTNVALVGVSWLDCYDGELEISQEELSLLGCSRVRVIGCSFKGRKNAVTGIVIGEPQPPVTVRTSMVEFTDNLYEDDHVTVGATSAFKVFNGSEISVTNNTFKRTNINGTTRFVEASIDSTMGTVADCTNNAYMGNRFIATGTVLTDVRAIVLDSEICTNTSVHFAGPNACVGVSSEVFEATTRTNTNIAVAYSSGARPGYFTPSDTTPTVTMGVNVLPLTGAATSISNLDDGAPWQEVTLLNGSASNMTIVFGNFLTPGGVNLVLGTGDVATARNRSPTTWYVQSNSNN